MNREQVQLKFEDMIPSSWFKNLDESSIWISCFKVNTLKKSDKLGYRIINGDNIIGVVITGRIPFLDVNNAVIQVDSITEGKLEKKAGVKKTSEGNYLLIIVPYKTDGVEKLEKDILFKISSFVGLLFAFNGRNMVYKKVFENEYFFQKSKLFCSGPWFINPASQPIPDLSDKRLVLIEEALDKIRKIEVSRKNRLELSLHWLDSAAFDIGIDSFIKYWIAIEVLAMPDSTKIKPINESLSKIYNLSLETTRDHFMLGRVFNLRGRIFHNGEKIPIHQNLQSYLKALYIDVLFYELEIPSEFRTQKVMENQNFNLVEYLHENS